MKKVSIIIPCYNDADFVADAVASAKGLVYQNKEIIIVDDGSNIETKKVLKNLQSDTVQLISQANKGLSAARNIGIKAATGTYILTHDADDIFDTSFLEKAVRCLEENETVGLVCSWVSVFIEFGTRIYSHHPKGGAVADFAFKNNAVSNLLFRKICWEEVEGYDENMRKGYEDWEFNLSVTKNGWTCEVIPEYLFHYRNKPDSMLKDANINHRESNIQYVFLKHADFYKSNFKGTIQHLTKIALEHKKNEQKRIASIDYKIGKAVLRPLRWFKKMVT